MNRLCILGRRKFTNLPSIPVDGTKVRRVPYPKYAQYALIGGGISLIGLIGIGAYLDQQRPTHPYRDLIQVLYDDFRKNYFHFFCFSSEFINVKIKIEAF